MRSLLVLLASLALAGCATSSGLHPNVLIERTLHSGGSALGVDPASQRAVSGGWEGMIHVWSLADGKALGRWRAHDQTVHGAVFLGPNRLLTAGYDGRIAVWDLQGNRLAAREGGSPITAFDISADNSRFVTGHADGFLRWWSAPALEPLGAMRVHEGAQVIAVAMQPKGTMTASSDDDGRVALVAPDGKPRWLDPPPTDALTLTFAMDGTALYGAGWFNLFRWDEASEKVRVLATDHRGQINSITFTPDGRELASISRQTDSAVLLLDPASGATRSALGKHDLCGGVVTLSPDGRYVVSTSDDASVRIWDRKNPLHDAPGIVIRKPEVSPGVF
jgi:WD40 repeat protein